MILETGVFGGKTANGRPAPKQNLTSQKYTRREAGRIVGLNLRQLRYWERLRLVHPEARWRERFYNFADIVALETIKRLTQKKVPARRLRRALAALERQFGGAGARIDKLRIVSNGRDIAVVPPGPRGQPFEPLTGQLLFSFDTQPLARKVQRIVVRSAEEWFELGLACDKESARCAEAAGAYRRVIELEPGWIEAHINLGVALYQNGEQEAAEHAFRAALSLDPKSAIAHFNLGCVLDELKRLDEAIRHLEQAVKLVPSYSDAHFNLGLALEKRGELRRAREHWAQYLRHDPRGTWADYARGRLVSSRGRKRPPAPIPFPKKR